VSASDVSADSVDAILERAAARGREQGVPYAGLITPAEAWRLSEAHAASIVDVRTRPEWELVGRIPESVLVEWRRYGETAPNAEFAAELAARFEPEDTLLFLCRSAVRSHHAAEIATRAGFSKSFNILEGFEGEIDSDQQRGRLAGWRKAGLPWIQS